MASICIRCRKQRRVTLIYLPFTDSYVALCVRCRASRVLGRLRELMA